MRADPDDPEAIAAPSETRSSGGTRARSLGLAQARRFTWRSAGGRRSSPAIWRRRRDPGRRRDVAARADARRDGKACAGFSVRSQARTDVEVIPAPSAARAGGRRSRATRGGYYGGLPRAAQGGAGVLHCTTFRGPLRAPVPFAVTLHDLALVRHPELFPRWHRWSGRAGIGPVARAADRVFAVSEFTKREAVELLGLPEEKVTVIGNAVDPVFSPSTSRTRRLRARGRDARAPEEPPARRQGRCQGGARARVAGAPSWSGVETRRLGRRSVRRGGSPRLYRGARASSFLRCTRDSGSRCSRRWRRGRRW